MNQPQADPEFKALMPPLTDEEYQQLEQNILAHRKCNDAILLWNGVIVDGFNRFCVCVTHGITFEVKEMDFTSRGDAKIWIIENQLGRRNLNAAARIELALCKAEVLREKAKERLSKGGGDKKSPFTKKTTLPEDSINVEKTIAENADVGQGTLQRYMQIKNSGKPHLMEQVKTGELKIGTAHRMLMSEIEKQLNQGDKILAYIRKHLPLENEAHDRHIRERLVQLAEQMRGLPWRS